MLKATVTVNFRHLSFELNYHNIFISHPTIFEEQLIAKPIWGKRAIGNRVIVGVPFLEKDEVSCPH